MKKKFLIALTVFISQTAFGQSTQQYDELIFKAESLYQAEWFGAS